MKLKSKLAGALVRLKKWASRYQRKREIFLIMEGGVVHEIVDLPDNIASSDERMGRFRLRKSA